MLPAIAPCFWGEAVRRSLTLGKLSCSIFSGVIASFWEFGTRGFQKSEREKILIKKSTFRITEFP